MTKMPPTPQCTALPPIRVVVVHEDGTRTPVGLDRATEPQADAEESSSDAPADEDAPTLPLLRPEIMDPMALVLLNIEVARGLCDAFQALRDHAQACELAALRLQLEAAAASVQVARAAAGRALACYRCFEVKAMGYVLDGKVCCRDCRGAHREEQYAQRGKVAPARQGRGGYSRAPRVAEIHVRADHVTVARVG